MSELLAADEMGTLAKVVPLVQKDRARELACSSPTAKDLELASFAASVRVVEMADGKPLYGKGRDACACAFAAHPIGFAAAVAESIEAKTRARKPVRSARAFLVWLIDKEWHLAAEALSSRSPKSNQHAINRCGCRHENCRYQDVCLEAAS